MNYDVVLVVSPFAVLNCPLMGPSVLAPQLREKGISTRVFYANILLASKIGTAAYDRFTDIDTPGGGTIGEALFSHWAGCRDLAFEEARQEISLILDIQDRLWTTVGSKVANPEAGQLREEVELCLDAIPAFLDKACEDVLSFSPKVVGFHVSDPHLTSAIALARRLKGEAPGLVTVMGGPFATSPMGKAIGDACGVFDFVFSGEADFAFPRFVETFLERGSLPEENVIECAPVPELDDVSVPDYDDYFHQMADAFPSERGGKDLVAGILFEASRGCWWGATTPCTFCGLDSPTVPHRSKSPYRVVEEIRGLPKRYVVNRLHTADVAFPRKFFKTVLPELIPESGNRPALGLNVRPDLQAEELDEMTQAGVTDLLCGIESFSTDVLQRLNKGVTAQQNLCLLRDCRSRNIRVAYVFLVGAPGEDPEDYRSMINLIPKIVHLQPPRFLWAVGIMRSSLYFRDPEKYGITDIHPSLVNSLIFGAKANLNEIAYTFEGTIPSEFLKNESLHREFKETVNTWCNYWQDGKRLPQLRRVPILPGQDAVEDTRECAVQEFYLPDDAEFELLDYLETPRRRSDVPGEYEAGLDNLLTRNFVVEHEGFLINIVT